METRAFRLAFSGGLRAGVNSGDVNRMSDAVTASTLWGGLGCCAARLADDGQVARLLTECRLSSLLWIDGERPLFPAPHFVPPAGTDIKALRRHRWLEFDDLARLVGGEVPRKAPILPYAEEHLTSAAIDRSDERALPYARKRLRPAPGCDGLLIAQLPRELEPLFRAALALLGDSGIGGERSHGWGLFSPSPVSLGDGVAEALDASGPCYLTLGALLPDARETSLIESMAAPCGYALWRLRGHVETGDTLKPTVTCLAHGSLLPFRPRGKTLVIGHAQGHPVFFNGAPPALALARPQERRPT